MKKLQVLVLRVAKCLVAALFVSGFTHAAETITHLAPLSGVWKFQGQGLVLEISGYQSRLYDLTSISCIQRDEGDGDDFFSAFQSVRLSSDRQQLTLTQLGNVVDTQFIKLTALPDRCANGGMPANSDLS